MGNVDPAKAKGRVIVFRLVGNPLLQIVEISGPGQIDADRRSAYSCCDADGRIQVQVRVPGGAAGESGGLWAIDPMVNDGAGMLAEFEVRTP